jgi:hypothetical protein
MEVDMAYVDDLERGFFLTIPSKNCGIYLSKNIRCYAYTSYTFSSYANLRIHKCRHCGCFFVLLNSTTELVLNLKIDWRVPSNSSYGKRCGTCVTDSAGLDAPLDEHRVYTPGHRRGLFKISMGG